MVAPPDGGDIRAMSRLERAATTALTCCRKPMSSIEVTSSRATGSSTLALWTCSACGRHIWQRDGVELDRSAVLDVVRDRIAEGPIPRTPQRARTDLSDS